MSTLSVSIVQLPPMRVISAYGYGPQPEDLAHAQMRAFMQAQGLLPEYGTKYRHFGFNNPSPAPGSPNYGYEIWVEAPAEIERPQAASACLLRRAVCRHPVYRARKDYGCMGSSGALTRSQTISARQPSMAGKPA